MITRENYEEFFLSYVDDELPVNGRAAVEQFVTDNPDLAPELEALAQCRVAPDHETGFRDKENLFQYESSLLNYVDAELEECERASLEEWVRLQPGVARELRQLQMTVSHPDLSIVHPDKESLYSSRRRRAVVLPWLRAGIAAAVLGGVALLVFQRPHTGGAIVVTDKKNTEVVTSVAPDTLYTKKKVESAGIEATERQTKPAAVAVKGRREQREEIKERPVVPVAAVKNEVVIVDPKPLKEQTLAVEQTKLSPAIAAVTIPREQSSFATQALMEQEQEDSTNNSIADASAAPAKNKLRGLFRKVGRAFGTTAERDGDGQRQVLISAFQVALK